MSAVRQKGAGGRTVCCLRTRVVFEYATPPRPSTTAHGLAILAMPRRIERPPPCRSRPLHPSHLRLPTTTACWAVHWRMASWPDGYAARPPRFHCSRRDPYCPGRICSGRTWRCCTARWRGGRRARRARCRAERVISARTGGGRGRKDSGRGGAWRGAICGHYAPYCEARVGGEGEEEAYLGKRGLRKLVFPQRKVGLIRWGGSRVMESYLISTERQICGERRAAKRRTDAPD